MLKATLVRALATSDRPTQLPATSSTPRSRKRLTSLASNVLVKSGDKEVVVTRGKTVIGTVICRSMDNPGSIVGFKIAAAVVDELDVLSREKAELVWNKIVARMRLVIPGVINHISVTTTPGGVQVRLRQVQREPDT